MAEGNKLEPKIRINPEEARFPAEPWPQQVAVEIKTFSVV
jgi:hypothetical protein